MQVHIVGYRTSKVYCSREKAPIPRVNELVTCPGETFSRAVVRVTYNFFLGEVKVEVSD
jgi:hypothetical protein